MIIYVLLQKIFMIETINMWVGDWCRVGNVRKNETNLKMVSNLWIYSDKEGMKCPKCKANLILVQVDPIEDWNNPYQSYETIVECTSCSFKTHAISYTILGSVKDYSVDHVTINGWSPSGSRVETTFEHILDYNLLKELKQSNEMVEFLIVEDHAIQVIG
jgi:hypothetical protein